MRNLEQIRAANALTASRNNTYKGVNDGQIVKKIPAMIRENGILGALAFALEKNDKGKVKNDGHYGVWQSIIAHLGCDGINRLRKACDPENLIEFLTSSENATAECLRDITDEALAFLNYLRRFATKGD